MADSTVVDKVTSVADLLLGMVSLCPVSLDTCMPTNLVVVDLCEFRVLEEVVGGKVEVELETRLLLVEVRQADIGQLLEDLGSQQTARTATPFDKSSPPRPRR